MATGGTGRLEALILLETLRVGGVADGPSHVLRGVELLRLAVLRERLEEADVLGDTPPTERAPTRLPRTMLADTNPAIDQADCRSSRAAVLVADSLELLAVPTASQEHAAAATDPGHHHWGHRPSPLGTLWRCTRQPTDHH